jgi:hypothetical protein
MSNPLFLYKDFYKIKTFRFERKNKQKQNE